MTKAYEVFNMYTGSIVKTFKNRYEAIQYCDKHSDCDYQEVKGFWQDDYNDYSVSEHFVVTN